MLSLTTTCRFQHRLKSSPNQSKHDHLVLDNQKNDTIATSNDAQKLFITLPKRQNCYKKPKTIALSLSHFQISISHSHSLSLSLSSLKNGDRVGSDRFDFERSPGDLPGMVQLCRFRFIHQPNPHFIELITKIYILVL